MRHAELGRDPILTARLIRKVDRALIELLESLTIDDWHAPTIVRDWKVLDVTSHLLDTALRKLSLVRDSHFAEIVVINSPSDVVELVNRLNEEGVRVYRRLSPAVLITLMKTACAESADLHESLEPFGPAAFPVSWAGEAESQNWFDTARELTERWHHQQQIRLAVNKPGIMTPELYRPVLDCFLRGLPHLYRGVEARADAAIEVVISGDCGGRCCLVQRKSGWRLEEPRTKPDARIEVPQEIAWRLFTKGIAREEAAALCRFEGDRALAEKVLQLTAIVG